jgi:hypothetical protein
LKKSEVQESVPCVRTTSEHYYGDACAGHHLDFIELVEPKVVEDEEETLSLADKLRRVDVLPYGEYVRRMGKVVREKAEAFELYNSETFDPEEE